VLPPPRDGRRFCCQIDTFAPISFAICRSTSISALKHLKSLIESAEAKIEESKKKSADSSAAIQKEKEAISQLLEFADGIAGKEGE